MSIKKLKWAAIVSFVVSLVILIVGGLATTDHLPPYPGKVVGPDGKVLFHKGRHFGRSGRVSTLWTHGSRQRVGARFPEGYGILGQEPSHHQ